MHRESETILLVEDNEPLREVTQDMLKGRGAPCWIQGVPLERFAPQSGMMGR